MTQCRRESRPNAVANLAEKFGSQVAGRRSLRLRYVECLRCIVLPRIIYLNFPIFSQHEFMSDKPKKSKDKKQKRSNEKKGGKKGPWYRDGLRFECTQCGACCSGEPGYVWVDQSEIEAMATEIGITVEAFEGKFIREIGNLRSLIEYPDGDCILLDPRTRKCLVYGSRPVQCRTWPFWDSTLEKKKDWKETCEICPGAGKGRLYSLEEIEIQRKQKPV